MTASPRLKRLLRLLGMLQTGRLLNADDLADELEVSRRTVFRDLGTLNDAGLDILFDDERQGYFLTTAVQVPAGALTVSEAFSLLLICQELGQADGGVPFHAGARSAAAKIAQRLPLALREFVQEAIEAVSIRLDAHNPLPGSSAVFDQLLKAWIERRTVRIEYESASERKQISVLLCPYRILFSRRSWYVIGRSMKDRDVRVYNVGRIVGLQMLDGRYQIPKRFHLDRFFGNAWHLIREPQRACEVVLKFTPLVARNVAEVRWHRTQQCTPLPDGGLQFTAQVDGLTEITWWILGYGDQVEVISPPELRQAIQQRITRMAAIYNS